MPFFTHLQTTDFQQRDKKTYVGEKAASSINDAGQTGYQYAEN
jgi:hypothetical protein